MFYIIIVFIHLFTTNTFYIGLLVSILSNPCISDPIMDSPKNCLSYLQDILPILSHQNKISSKILMFEIQMIITATVFLPYCYKNPNGVVIIDRTIILIHNVRMNRKGRTNCKWRNASPFEILNWPADITTWNWLLLVATTRELEATWQDLVDRIISSSMNSTRISQGQLCTS